MYSYLYDNKFLLWITIIFMFIGMITVTIILYLFFLSIVKRKKEKGKLSEKHSPYDFESTQQNAANKKFRFMEYLYSGDYVEVIKEFKDYYGFTHQVGEKFYFACVYFLPYEDGYTLFISKDKINIDNIFLQNREETQKEICYNLKEYFKVIEQGRFKRD